MTRLLFYNNAVTSILVIKYVFIYVANSVLGQVEYRLKSMIN